MALERDLGPALPVGELVERLSSRAMVRTEANVQSDLRTLLLYGGLELDAPQVVDLEVQTGDGTRRRIDVEAGFAVIEVKKDLTVGNVRREALQQLSGYVRTQTERLGQRYVGVLTDGAEWSLCHLRSDGTLAIVSQHHVAPRSPDVEALLAWLSAVLATESAISPTPLEIERRLGASSPAFRLDYAALQELYDQCRDHAEVRLKRELWARLLTTAYGVNFEDDDTLFVEHTYLVLVAEIIAHAVVGIDPAATEPADLASGRQFGDRQVYGVVEADFFDWPLAAPGGEDFLRGMARRIARFDWAGVDHDVLKLLYESVIDAEQRHALGEYYTPDWLAEAAVAEAVKDPLNQRVLDPSCGSGTFLFHAVRVYLDVAAAAGISNAEAVQGVTDHVFGVDIHPVAVTLARVTYLLGIGFDRLGDRGSLTVPVYVGDSLQWGHEETLLTDGSIVISTADGLELLPREIRFPAAVIDDVARFDHLVGSLANKATNRGRGSAVPSIKGILNRYSMTAEDKDVVTQTFRVMCDLHDNHRNHIWSYYVRNLARPVWLARPVNRCDVIIGNPPWLSYRYMTPVMRTDFKEGSEERGLWAGAALATSQDLSAYFVARTVQLYLRQGGAFAFVMPNATLARPHFAGFRMGLWPAADEETAVSFATPWDLSGVRPHVFPMPCALVLGHRSESAESMGDVARAFTGRTPRLSAPWADVRDALQEAEGTIVRPAGAKSSYGATFRQGATVTPRVLLTVEAREATDALGGEVGRRCVRSIRSGQEKRPWKQLDGLEGAVEEQFIHPLHVGATIAPFICLKPIEAVIPWIGDSLLDGSSDLLDEYPGVAQWWRDAEAVWMRHRSDGDMSLRDRLDYHQLLSTQFPIAPHRVAYNRSGTRLVAAYIQPSDAVIDTKLYWGAIRNRGEADYLCAILNAPIMTELVNPLQGRGQFGPRDFYGLPFEFPIPVYNSDSELHERLRVLGSESTRVANEVPEVALTTYRRARNAVRGALDRAGLGAQANDLVAELLLV